MIIKLLLLSSMLIVGVLVLRGRATATKVAVKRMAGCLLLLVGMSAVLFPGGVTWVANVVGVGRGTDLVLYLVTMAFLFVSIALYGRMSELENRYVALARRVAIDEAAGRLPREADGDRVSKPVDSGVSTPNEY